jgi:nucleoside-diphosphate-sugar epimerase
MKIILTGASGNLGSHISKIGDHQYLQIGRSNWKDCEEVSLGEFDSIIHCAYDLKNSINTSPVKNLDSNIISTARMLEICLSKKIKKFIFISSCAVYGDSSNSSEDKPCQPVTMNGHIKLFNEELVKSFCLANQIDYLIFRVFNTYGGNDEFSVIQRMVNCAKTGKVFTLVNDGISERDFIHVEDVAKIVSGLIGLNLRNEIINIGSGESVRIIDILKLVEKIYGEVKVEKKSNPNESVFSRANIQKLNSLITSRNKSILNVLSKNNE